MKRKNKLISLAALFLVILGVYFVISALTAEEAGEEVASESITLTSIDSDTLASMQWEYNGEAITLSYSDEQWSYNEDSDFPLDQSIAEAMASAVINVSATRKLEDIEDISEYGLKEPVSTIKVACDDGSETNFKIGNINNSTGEYYVQLNEEDTVYTVDSTLYTAFSYGLYDLIDMEELPLISDITSFKVVSQDKAYELVNIEDSSDISYTNDYYWFLKEANKELKAIDEYKAESLQGQITSLSWVECVAYNAEQKDLEEYGLDNPEITVNITYIITETVDTGETDDDGNAITETKEEEVNFKLLIGDSEDGYSYAMIDGSDMIYTILESVSDELKNGSYDTLCPDDVILMDWDTVDSMDITIDGTNHTLGIERTEETDDEGNTEEVITYYIDGEEADQDLAETFLDSITGLTADGQAEGGELQSSGDVMITFYRNTDNYKEMPFILSKYDSSFYLVSFNEEARLLVNKNDVASLINSFKDIME